MGDPQPFSSILEASNRARAITLRNFSLEGEDLTDGAQALVRCFNCDWDTAIYSLQSQQKPSMAGNTYKPSTPTAW